jgi:hypothetical protein
LRKQRGNASSEAPPGVRSRWVRLMRNDMRHNVL